MTGRRAALPLALLTAAACRTPAGEPSFTAAPGAGVPAVIAEPTPASRAALAAAVSSALHGAPVTLADDALTRTNLLVVERARLRDLSARVLERPERFRLVKRGDACVLVHEGGGEATLAGTRCTAAPPE